MTANNFWRAYALVFIAQLLLSNYFDFAPWITATLLPAMILCLPLTLSTAAAMVIAFVTGLGVDFLADGAIGLNALALVPVALARNGILELVLGQEIITRKKQFNFRRNGFGPVALAVVLALAIFLTVYVWASTAGTRSFLFCLGYFWASVLPSLVFSLLAVRALAPTDIR